MARSTKSSPAEDLMEAVSMLPWWAGVILAVIAYFVLAHFASQPASVAIAPGQVGDAAVKTMGRTLAGIGQIVVPLLCLVGAVASAFRQRQRQQLFDNATSANAVGTIANMGWQEFEQLVGEYFRRRGYTVLENGGGGPDGGVDLVLTRDGETHLVQCKQWRALKVGVEVVRELYGVMAARGASSGSVVSSGRYTEEAVRFATGRNITLIDGARLHQLIHGNVACPTKAGVGATPVAKTATDAAKESVPCPLCAEPMVRRQARRGANAGNEFWGCRRYPACKGTRPLA